MLEKTQKRKLRKDLPENQEDKEVVSFIAAENRYLSEQDFEDISNKIENQITKRFRDTEHSQKDI